MTPNPDNLEQRISERRDRLPEAAGSPPATGPSDPLAALIAQDPDVANLDKAYARLGHMLNGWRKLPEGVDFRSFRTGVTGAVAADVEYRALQAHAAGESPDIAGLTAEDALNLARAYQKTDDAIRAAAGPMPAVDWNALKSRISAAVRTEAAESDPHHERTILLPAATKGGTSDKRKHRDDGGLRFRRAIQRFVLPLSAAAAVALTATLWFNRDGSVKQTPAPTNVNRIVVNLGAPTRTGSIELAFDESPMTAAAEPLPTRGAAIAVGPGYDELTTIPDDALWQ